MKNRFFVFVALILLTAASYANTLRGLVLLPDGKPAVGAEVVLINGTGDEDQPLVTAIAQADGTFAIKSTDLSFDTPEDSHDFVAHLSGYGLTWRKTVQPGIFTLRLAPSGPRVLRALDEAGKPIANFQAALYFLHRPHLPWDVWDVLDLPASLAENWALHASNNQVRLVTTPAHLTARWRVTAPGFAPQSVMDTGAAKINVRLQRAATVRGKITGDGPLPPNLKINASVSIKTDPTGWLDAWGKTIPVTPEGTFEIAMLPGKANFRIVRDWLSPRQFEGETSVEIKSGAIQDIAISSHAMKTGPILARVMDDSGAPVRGGRFVVGDPAFLRLPPTGDDGMTRFFAAPGKMELFADPPPAGYLRSATDPQMDRQITIPAGDEAFQLPDLVLPRAARMQVRVVSPTGEPLPAVWVESSEDAGLIYGHDTLLTDDVGIARFTRLDGKKAQFVRAHTPQGFSATLAVPLPLPNNVTLTFRPTFTRLVVRIMDDAGQPLSHTTVTAMARDISAKRDNEPSQDIQLKTDATGHLFSPPLPPQMSYRLSLAPPGVVPLLTAWRPARGAQIVFGTVVLQRLNGVLRGTVQDARGKALQGVRIWSLSAEHLNAARKTISDVRGAFRLDKMPKRTLLVFAQDAKGEIDYAYAPPNAKLNLQLGHRKRVAQTTTSQERRALARRLLKATMREVQNAKPGEARINNLAYLAAQLARCDANRARQLVASYPEAREYLLAEQFSQALEREPPNVTRAMACWNALKPAEWRTYRLTNETWKLAAHHPDAARLLLPLALRTARSTSDIPARLSQLTTLLGTLARLHDSGVPLLRAEIEHLVILLPDDSAKLSARLNLAGNLAFSDVDVALTMIEPLSKSAERARVMRQIARRLAPRDAERAIRLVREAVVENDSQSYLEASDEAMALLCPAIAKTNLPRAIALTNSLPPGYPRALAHFLLAQQQASKSKKQARIQLEAAILEASNSKGVAALETDAGWRAPEENYVVRSQDQENLDSLRLLLARAARRWNLPGASELTLRALASNAVGTFSAGGGDYVIQQDAAATMAAAQILPAYARDWVKVYWPRVKARDKNIGLWTLTNMMVAAAFSDTKLCEKIWREMPAGQRAYCTGEFYEMMQAGDASFERAVRTHLHLNYDANM